MAMAVKGLDVPLLKRREKIEGPGHLSKELLSGVSDNLLDAM